MSVVEAVERDLAAIAKTDPALAKSTLAAIALSSAALLDNPKESATSKSMNHHQLRDTMKLLRDLAPPVKPKDDLDKLRKRRANRRAKAKDRSQAAP